MDELNDRELLLKREDCWMTFSEALEGYLDARAEVAHFGEGFNRQIAKEKMEIAKQHMNALTSLEASDD